MTPLLSDAPPSAPRPASDDAAPGGPGAPTSGAGYRALKVWQRGMDLAAGAHGVLRCFPKAEQERLAADLLRAAVAVPAQIAAGNTAFDRAEHARALAGAQGSLARFETLVLLAERLGALPDRDAASLLAQAADVGRLLRGLARAVSGRGEGAAGPVRAPIEARRPVARRAGAAVEG